jgi:hypothetical protein
VQFNVVSFGPVDIDAHGGNASAHATILATMCEYFSLGCMGSAKKGEYSLTAGYQQFFDYFDNFFRLIMTECFTYVSAYISPFNSGNDIIMKHFCRVFDDCGSNPISDTIRGMWGWWDYLQRVQPDVCVLGAGLTAQSIDDALRNCRCNLQLAVQTLFGPILEQLDEHAIGEITGDVESEIGSSSSGSSGSSSYGMSSLGSGRSRRLVEDVLGDGSLQDTMGSDVLWVEGIGSRSSRDSRESVESAEPSLQAMGMGMGVGAHGGTNKKTRKYRTNRRSKSRSRSRSKIGGNRNRNTRKNTHVSRTKTKTNFNKI